MEKKIYQRLAGLISWNPPKDSEWVNKRDERIEAIMKTAPHGSGIDGDVRLVEAECSESKLVFRVECHRMNSAGYIDEEGIAEYITDCFYTWSLTECKEVK